MGLLQRVCGAVPSVGSGQGRDDWCNDTTVQSLSVKNTEFRIDSCSVIYGSEKHVRKTNQWEMD